MIMANDATVKGGTSYPISVTKSLRAQDIARFSTNQKNPKKTDQQNHVVADLYESPCSTLWTLAGRSCPCSRKFFQMRNTAAGRLGTREENEMQSHVGAYSCYLKLEL